VVVLVAVQTMVALVVVEKRKVDEVVVVDILAAVVDLGLGVGQPPMVEVEVLIMGEHSQQWK